MKPTPALTQRPRGLLGGRWAPPPGGRIQATQEPAGPREAAGSSTSRCPSQTSSEGRGSACIPLRYPNSPSRLKLSGVSRSPSLPGGPCRKQGGSFIIVPRHTPPGLCATQRTKATVSFPGGNGKGTATSTAGSPGLGTAPRTHTSQPEGHCCFPRGEANSPRPGTPWEGTGPRSLWEDRSRAPS